jgi:hypothetical protein
MNFLFIQLGFLNALVPNEEVGENIPSFLGRGDVADECLVLLGKRHVNEMQGGGIELLVDLFPRKQVGQVLGSWMKTLLNDPLKLNRHKVYVRALIGCGISVLCPREVSSFLGGSSLLSSPSLPGSSSF